MNSSNSASRRGGHMSRALAVAVVLVFLLLFPGLVAFAQDAPDDSPTDDNETEILPTEDPTDEVDEDPGMGDEDAERPVKREERLAARPDRQAHVGEPRDE